MYKPEKALGIREQRPELNFDYIKEHWKFPSEKPKRDNPVAISHLGISNQQKLPEFINKDTKIILDCGVYYGNSSMFFANLIWDNPDSFVIGIDMWYGSLEHSANPALVNNLKYLYDDYVINVWDYREKLIPLKMDIRQGLDLLYVCKVEPDIIYLDGDHSFDAVTNELEQCYDLFGTNGKTLVCGDDMPHSGVNLAVKTFCKEKNVEYGEHGNVWWLKINNVK